MSEVKLVGVSKSFGSVHALREVSLAVADGELVSLLGPSGCGKTTLLRAVAGLERPDEGRIHIGGVDITDRPTRERPIGVVFQNYALFPNMTVRRNIAFPLEVRGWPAERVARRVQQLLELVRLEPEVDRYPNQISGGQAQRCALARALAPDPQVLLLDEPLSALDVVVRAHLRDEIRRVQQEVRATTIYVTHDQAEALAIGDRVAIMNGGSVEQVGSAMEVYGAPATLFSAGFVGNRNALTVPVEDGRVNAGALFDLPAPAGANGRAVAYFAPEDVIVRSAADPGHAARIESMSFRGATTRVGLQTVIGTHPVTMYADLPSRQARNLQAGEPVSISVPAAAVSTFADD